MYVDIDSLVVSKEEFEKHDTVGESFILLQTNMRALLQNAKIGDLRRACVAQMHNPRGVELAQELVNQILKTENTDNLFDLLVCTPYWSWIEIRILEMMAVASKSSPALQLLKNYKAAIFSKLLIEVLPNIPTKEVKQQYYKKVVSKIKKESNEMTVADLQVFQSQLEVVIMDIKRGACQLGSLREGCIEAHWYIPTDCVDQAYENARLKCYKFNELDLQYLIIGQYPKICNPADTLCSK